MGAKSHPSSNLAREVPIPEDLRITPTSETTLLAPFGVKVEMIREAIQEGKAASPDFLTRFAAAARSGSAAGARSGPAQQPSSQSGASINAI